MIIWYAQCLEDRAYEHAKAGPFLSELELIRHIWDNYVKFDVQDYSKDYPNPLSTSKSWDDFWKLVKSNEWHREMEYGKYFWNIIHFECPLKCASCGALDGEPCWCE